MKSQPGCQIFLSSFKNKLHNTANKFDCLATSIPSYAKLFWSSISYTNLLKLFILTQIFDVSATAAAFIGSTVHQVSLK